MTQETKSLTPHPYRCQAHRMWMKKGVCELCRMEADKRQKELEKLTGSNKQTVKITKL